MLDLTLPSFAYLRIPLLIAAIAALLGAVGNFRAAGVRAFFAAALMMVLFLHAARLAMVVFDPYLSSRPLAEALLRSPGRDFDLAAALLSVFVRVLLREPHGIAAERPHPEFGVWLERSRRAGRLY